MTLQSSVSRVIYRGDGNQKEFPIPFRFLKTGHIAVFSPEGIVSGTDYEVSGNIQGNGFSGGTVVFRNAPSGAVAILRMVPFVQESDYVPNGDVPAETLEGNLDYLTMQTQELLEAVGRCVKMPETSDLTPEEWMEAFKKTIEASKDAALDASVSASNSAASASSCLAVIATIMTELTGDPAWAEESKNVLQEIWEAKGAVEAAREVAIGDISNRADVAKAAVAESARQAQEAAEASIDNKLVDAETEINAKVSAAIGADSVFDAALTEAKDNLNSDVQAALDSAEAVASGYVQQVKDAVDEAIADWEAIRDQAVADGNKALEELAAAKLAALKDIGDKVTEAQASSDNALGYSNSALAAAQSAAGEAAKAEAARIAAEAAESNIGNVVNVSLTAHNASAEAHPGTFVKCSGDSTVTGNLTLSGDGKGNLTASGTVSAGYIKSDGNIKAAGSLEAAGDMVCYTAKAKRVHLDAVEATGACDIYGRDVNGVNMGCFRTRRDSDGKTETALVVYNPDGSTAASLAIVRSVDGVGYTWLNVCNGYDTEVARCDWVKNQIAGGAPGHPNFSAAVDLTAAYNADTGNYGWTATGNGWILAYARIEDAYVSYCIDGYPVGVSGGSSYDVGAVFAPIQAGQRFVCYKNSTITSGAIGGMTNPRSITNLIFYPNV